MPPPHTAQRAQTTHAPASHDAQHTQHTITKVVDPPGPTFPHSPSGNTNAVASESNEVCDENSPQTLNPQPPAQPSPIGGRRTYGPPESPELTPNQHACMQSPASQSTGHPEFASAARMLFDDTQETSIEGDGTPPANSVPCPPPTDLTRSPARKQPKTKPGYVVARLSRCSPLKPLLHSPLRKRRLRGNTDRVQSRRASPGPNTTPSAGPSSAASDSNTPPIPDHGTGHNVTHSPDPPAYAPRTAAPPAIVATGDVGGTAENLGDQDAAQGHSSAGPPQTAAPPPTTTPMHEPPLGGPADNTHNPEPNPTSGEYPLPQVATYLQAQLELTKVAEQALAHVTHLQKELSQYKSSTEDQLKELGRQVAGLQRQQTLSEETTKHQQHELDHMRTEQKELRQELALAKDQNDHTDKELSRQLREKDAAIEQLRQQLEAAKQQQAQLSQGMEALFQHDLNVAELAERSAAQGSANHKECVSNITKLQKDTRKLQNENSTISTRLAAAVEQVKELKAASGLPPPPPPVTANQVGWICQLMANQVRTLQQEKNAAGDKHPNHLLILKCVSKDTRQQKAFGALTDAQLGRRLSLPTSDPEPCTIVQRFRPRTGKDKPPAWQRGDPCSLMIVAVVDRNLKQSLLKREARTSIKNTHEIILQEYLTQTELQEQAHLQTYAMGHLHANGYKAGWDRSRATWKIPGTNTYAFLSGYDIPPGATEEEVVAAARIAETRCRADSGPHTNAHPSAMETDAPPNRSTATSTQPRTTPPRRATPQPNQPRSSATPHTNVRGSPAARTRA
jgi:hypothetical protein